MNVQDNEQRQGTPVAIAGTDARCETADVKRAKRAPNGSRGIETFAEGTTPLIQQDYERAMQIASQLTGVSITELTGKQREDTMAFGRMIVAWYLFEKLEYTRRDISRVFCRDRSTIYYYCRKFPELISVGDKKAIRLHDAFINAITD